MNFNKYQKLSSRTANKDLDREKGSMVYALGINGEAGELAEDIKHHFVHGHEVSKEQIAEEMGDLLWYISQLADLWDISFDEVAEGNIDKLRNRYPEGFSKERSINRSDEGLDKQKEM